MQAIIAAGLLAWPMALAAPQPAPVQHDIVTMGWQPAYHWLLPAAHAELSLWPEFAIIDGADAVHYRELMDHRPARRVIAAASNFATGMEAELAVFPLGHVSDTDWAEMDPVVLLRHLRRASAGLERPRITGWVRRPVLDPDQHLVSWGVLGRQPDGAGMVNAVALVLTREGVIRIGLVAPLTQYNEAMGQVLAAAHALRLRPGWRYADYRPGERLAGFGITELVAANFGLVLHRLPIAPWVARIGCYLLGVLGLGIAWLSTVSLLLHRPAVLPHPWRNRARGGRGQATHASTYDSIYRLAWRRLVGLTASAASRAVVATAAGCRRGWTWAGGQIRKYRATRGHSGAG